MKTLKVYADEMGIKGAISILFGGALLVILLLILYQLSGQPAGTAPLTETKQVVPATGPQGFRAEEFCEESTTSVRRWLIPPIDSEYTAAYSMERRKAGVLETVDVFVFGDARDPRGIHYMADGTSEDAFITKDIIKCIEDKVK